ncbi:MAG: hypothetical protein R6U67_14515 [Sodalinema sp.]|uniref:hypothetical protein n=1 Tax=Sodalinema sp. TaxID=3080550 RepID=UPI001226B43B|nr:MAG: hypothetical protein EYR95_08425 [Phormidium sp. SL48-SHIP]
MSNSQLNLNFGDGSVSLSFSKEAAQDLQGALRELLGRLKAVATNPAGGSQRPTPQKPMEYRHQGPVFLEVFCNPNIWASPFAAKILLTVRDERIRLTTEVDLTQVLEDLEQYLQQFDD